MSETKGVFAERTLRSLKNIPYRYMEDYGHSYIHKLPQLVTTLNSRRNCSIDMRLNTVKNCDFMSDLYSKPLREYQKPTFKTGDTVRISKHNLLFRKGYKPHFTRKIFEILANATKTPPTYTIKNEQGEIIQGNFLSKKADQRLLTMDSFTIELVSSASGELFPNKTLSSFTNFLTE